MLQGLVVRANRLLDTLQDSLGRGRLNVPSPELLDTPSVGHSYESLKKVILPDQVSRTLFQEYTEHRASERREEETGWELLGLREADHAVVLATLPAGARRDAGVAHVRFNTDAQALAVRILRQMDKRLMMLGVVHTHPGSLRHPSDGDYQGDSAWVGRLRGGQGIFGIGTSDGPNNADGSVAHQPRSHVQTLGRLVFSWYVLGQGDRKYRPLPVQLTLGPDLALPLHAIWPLIEEYAEPLNRLCRQLASYSFSVVPGRSGSALAVMFKLAEPGETLRVVLDDGMAAYYLQRGSEFMAVDAPAPELDRACYLILAELAARDKMR
jgi:proteasome lid subunit RPN8/RPN11